MGHSAKFFFIFFFSFFLRKKDFISLPSVLDLGTRQSFFFIFYSPSFSEKDFISLPSVFLILGKQPLCRVFLFWYSAKSPVCRVFFLPSVFSAALGKELVRRVPEGIHSANRKTLGKFQDSDSAYCYVLLLLSAWNGCVICLNADREYILYPGES